MSNKGPMNDDRILSFDPAWLGPEGYMTNVPAEVLAYHGNSYGYMQFQRKERTVILPFHINTRGVIEHGTVPGYVAKIWPTRVEVVDSYTSHPVLVYRRVIDLVSGKSRLDISNDNRTRYATRDPLAVSRTAGLAVRGYMDRLIRFSNVWFNEPLDKVLASHVETHYREAWTDAETPAEWIPTILAGILKLQEFKDYLDRRAETLAMSYLETDATPEADVTADADHDIDGMRLYAEKLMRWRSLPASKASTRSDDLTIEPRDYSGHIAQGFGLAPVPAAPDSKPYPPYWLVTRIDEYSQQHIKPEIIRLATEFQAAVKAFRELQREKLRDSSSAESST